MSCPKRGKKASKASKHKKAVKTPNSLEPTRLEAIASRLEAIATSSKKLLVDFSRTTATISSCGSCGCRGPWSSHLAKLLLETEAPRYTEQSAAIWRSWSEIWIPRPTLAPGRKKLLIKLDHDEKSFCNVYCMCSLDRKNIAVINKIAPPPLSCRVILCKNPQTQ